MLVCSAKEFAQGFSKDLEADVIRNFGDLKAPLKHRIQRDPTHYAVRQKPAPQEIDESFRACREGGSDVESCDSLPRLRRFTGNSVAIIVRHWIKWSLLGL